MGVINMVRLQISCNNQFYQKQMCITKRALFSYITWQKYFKINFFDTKGHHLFCMWVFRYTGIAYQLLSCTNVKKKKKKRMMMYSTLIVISLIVFQQNPCPSWPCKQCHKKSR